MVLQLLGDGGAGRHETECEAEVGEVELAVQFRIRQLPSGQGREPLGDLVIGESYGSCHTHDDRTGRAAGYGAVGPPSTPRPQRRG